MNPGDRGREFGLVCFHVIVKRLFNVLMCRLTPSYDMEFNNGMLLTLYGTVSVVDDRWSDNANTVVLDGYEKLDLGLIFNATENLSFQLVADNVTDEEALTEGDPRDPASPNGRFIMPRTFKASVAYNF